YTVYTFSCLSSCFVVIIIIKHEMENEQLLIGIARFFICEKLVFAQPLCDRMKYRHLVFLLLLR
ncbi:hypothetical protein, partial [Streptococcus suis]|uniref:hypothetical protein n=1 Tax=Streptococcus suis TaxID=1307 RepID=UPI001EE6BB35